MQRYLLRLGLIVAICAVCTVVVTVGVGFLLAAMYLAILDLSSPTVAALSTGAGALVLASLLALLARSRIRGGIMARTGEKGSGRLPADGEFVAELGLLLGSEARSWIRSNTLSSVTLALTAGFVVGASPGLRSVLRELLGSSR